MLQARRGDPRQPIDFGEIGTAFGSIGLTGAKGRSDTELWVQGIVL